MKKVTNYIWLIGLSLTLGSCGEDFLDLHPISELSSANYWQTQEDAEAALVGAYDALKPDSYYGFDMYVIGEVASDNNYAGGDNPNNFAYEFLSVNPINQVVQRNWAQIYNAIGRTNILITRVGAMDDDSFEGDLKANILGEGYFLRGLHYFNLVRIYGGVPLVLEETVSLAPEAIQVPRNTEEEVWAQIISDFERAADQLPSQPRDGGRASKGAAEAFLANAYLYQENYGAVDTYSQMAMSHHFRLLDDYDHLFDQEHKNNQESLFAVQYLQNLAGNVLPELILPVPEAAWEFLKFNVPTEDIDQAYEENDLRKPSSIVVRNDVRYVYKWRNGDAFASGDHNTVMRFAELLLIRAEAINRLGRTAEALELLNQIRERAGLAQYDGPTDMESVDQAIFAEKRVELAFEGQRWFELKRKGYQVTRAAIQRAKGRELPDYRMLSPLPQAEIDRNPNLAQNPGY